MTASLPPEEPSAPGIRLNKFIAAAGIASRRGAEELIRGGAVMVNGREVRSLATLVDPTRDSVRVHGKVIKHLERKVYLVLNKPRGYICTRSDEHDRPTVLDLVPSKPRLFPVGRLDYDAEGVLLLTNDGDFAHTLLHPRYGVPRTYLVKVLGQPSAAELRRLTTGLPLADGRRARAEVSVEAKKTRHVWLRMTLQEGRHGQIKEMCRLIAHPVLKLKRISFGLFTVAGLKPGGWRHISDDEFARLRRRTQNAAASPRRGGAKGRGTAGARKPCDAR